MAYLRMTQPDQTYHPQASALALEHSPNFRLGTTFSMTITRHWVNPNIQHTSASHLIQISLYYQDYRLLGSTINAGTFEHANRWENHHQKIICIQNVTIV